MEYLQQAFGFLAKLQFTIPLSQVLLAGLLSSLFLILGKHKIGLLASYAFIFYWGFILNRGFFMKELSETAGGVYFYGAMGMVMGLVAFVGLVKSSD